MSNPFRGVILAVAIPLLAASQIRTWEQLQDIPTPRWHLASAVIDGKVYALGGVGGYQQVEAFDPTTGQWEARAFMTVARAFLGTGVVNGKLYAIGGSRLNATPSNTVEVYDPATDTWSTRAPMSSGRRGICSSVVEDRIYVFGGNDPPETTASMYDPAADAWTDDLADMPTARWDPECVAVGGKVFVFGGFLSVSSGIGSDDVEMYDPATDSWTTLAKLPAPRGAGAVASVQGRIYYLGGAPDFGVARQNAWVYDPSSDAWSVLDDMPFPWFLMGGAEVDGTIYLMAGSEVRAPHGDRFRGTYSFTPSQTQTGLGSPGDENVGRPSLDLDQNYPNPFVSKTTITYHLRHPSDVQLKIYNVLGQAVHSANLGRQQAGSRQVSWDASAYNVGLYLYQIVTPDNSIVKRATVLR